MENKETPKVRRPLPIPRAVPAQRPNTPIPGALNSAVAPANFYGTPKVPTLPTRSSNIGSSHTAYIPPEEPPAYGSSPGYREPELVTEDTMDSLPPLTPSDSQSWNDKVGTVPYDSQWQENSWAGADSTGWEPYNNPVSSAAAWETDRSANGLGFDTMDYMSAPNKSLVDVVIEGRDEFEEKNWWDASIRLRNLRPGPGMLPPVLAEELHDPDHSLFSVSVTPPDIRMPVPPPPSSTSDQAPDQPPASSPPTRTAWTSASQTTPTPTAVPSTSTSAPPPPPPTEDDVRTAVPHPNAYYCPKENGWVILSWKRSSVAPPLAQSFRDSVHNPLPDQARRKRTDNCLSDTEQPFGRANKTHHFHKYEKAVDSHMLTPAFRREEWEANETIKQRRRGGTIIEDIDVKQINPQEIDMISEDEEGPEEEGRLLDLYVCCQCTFYCVASGVIPGVIPRKCFDEFVREKRNNPQPGKSGEQGIVMAFETIIMLVTIRNILCITHWGLQGHRKQAVERREPFATSNAG